MRISWGSRWTLVQKELHQTSAVPETHVEQPGLTSLVHSLIDLGHRWRNPGWSALSPAQNQVWCVYLSLGPFKTPFQYFWFFLGHRQRQKKEITNQKDIGPVIWIIWTHLKMVFSLDLAMLIIQTTNLMEIRLFMKASRTKRIRCQSKSSAAFMMVPRSESSNLRAQQWHPNENPKRSIKNKERWLVLGNDGF